MPPLTLRGTTFRHRIRIAATYLYSFVDGPPDDWHLVHLGGLARGGARLVVSETGGRDPGEAHPPEPGNMRGSAANEQVTAYEHITSFECARGGGGRRFAHLSREGSSSVPCQKRG